MGGLLMKSIQFPDIFNRNSVNLVSDYEATKQNLKLLLYSDKEELFGDPYYGMGFKRYLFSQNDVVLQDLLVDDIYTAIKVFMPQISTNRDDIHLEYITRATTLDDGTILDKGDIHVTIKAMNKANFKTDLYSIALLQNEV